MYAVIETGGKQYRVTAGQKLKIEKLVAETGDDIEFDQVLLAGEGENVQVGVPYLSSGKVCATVLEHGREKKINIIKFRRRKNSKRQQGHRQSFTQVQINTIEV